MMLDGDDVESSLIGEQELVDAFLEEICGYLRIAVEVGQARAYRRCAIEHVLRHMGIRDFALIPDVHDVRVTYSGGFTFQKPRLRCFASAITRAASSFSMNPSLTSFAVAASTFAT